MIHTTTPTQSDSSCCEYAHTTLPKAGEAKMASGPTQKSINEKCATVRECFV